MKDSEKMLVPFVKIARAGTAQILWQRTLFAETIVPWRFLVLSKSTKNIDTSKLNTDQKKCYAVF